MSLSLSWLGRSDLDRIAALRGRCYGTPAEFEKFHQRTENDRFDDGDVLVLTQDGVDIATATSLRLKVNISGTIVPCQGVAWVGTARTHRRRRIDGRGVASHVMHALRAKAIERGECVSMLAPFRVSFYERFGYGIVERQATWTVPLALMPTDGGGNFKEVATAGSLNSGEKSGATVGAAAASDFAAALASRDRQFRQTHGDVETNARSLQFWLTDLRDLGFRLLDTDGQIVRSQFTLGTEVAAGQSVAVVHRPWWDSPAALRSLLAMLGTLKDQYSTARITLPADFPLNWMLAEKQVPHRRIDHAAPTCVLTTRMQAAIINPVSFCAALRPPTAAAGVVTVAVRMYNGATQTLCLDFADGRVTAKLSSDEPHASLSDVAFAAIAFGDLSATDAVATGQLDLRRPGALPLLQQFSAGPRPYCHEYF